MAIKYGRADTPQRELWPLYAGIEKAERLRQQVEELRREFDSGVSIVLTDLAGELGAMQAALVELNLLPLVRAVGSVKAAKLTDGEFNALRGQLAAARQLLGLTQADVAHEAAISPAGVQDLERGRYRTTPRVLAKYVAVLVTRAIERGIDPSRLPPLATALEIVAAKRTATGRRGNRGPRAQKPIDQSQPPTPTNSSKQN